MDKSGGKGDSRPLVEDGCRSVVNEGGPEVDLQGTVTAGRRRGETGNSDS